MDSLTDILISGASHFGIGPKLSEDAAASFIRYRKLLTEHNRVMNLTAITGAEDIVKLHFLDSLALFLVNDFKHSRVIDIGSGAGFPGVPLRLTEPTINLTLLDSTAKRVEFLSRTCKALNLTEVMCIHGRAEELALSPDFRASFDFAVSRAVSRLNLLCELCLPFVRIGGLFIAMKSALSDDETREAGSAIKALGAEFLQSVDYAIPGTDITHRLVVIKKTGETPEIYPRRFAKIQKSPL